MAVNYIMTPQPVTVTGGEDWNFQDVALPGATAGDGVVDNGDIPLKMVIKPSNVATHTVAASSFTVGGLEPVDQTNVIGGGLYPGWEYGSVSVREWIYGSVSWDTGTTLVLPDGVAQITMYDWDPVNNAPGTPNAVGNEVVVLAYLFDDYSVPTDDTSIIIDIDGDATPINPDPSENSSFLIKVRLGMDIPNCSVHAFISDFENNTSSTLSSDFNYSVYETNGQEASIQCVPSDTWTENSRLFSEGSTKLPWFYITANEGYYVSKNNFYVNYNASYSTTGSDDPDGLTALEMSNSCSNCPSPFGPFSMPSDSLTSQYPDPAVTLTYSDGTITPSYFSNIQSIYDPSYTESVWMSDTYTSYSNAAQTLSVAYNSAIFWGNNSGENNSLFWGSDGEIPSLFCASDWDQNAVAIRLVGLYNYIPGLDAPDLTFRINGKSMEPGDNCVDIDIDISVGDSQDSVQADFTESVDEGNDMISNSYDGIAPFSF